MLIAITGTPGTGKSTLAQEIEQQGFYRMDLHNHYKELSVGYDEGKKCYDIDIEKFKALVEEKTKKHKKIVLDSHIAHLLPQKFVDLCVVLICSDLKKLEKRLQERGYDYKKVRENLDVEIFQVCLNEAKEAGHNVAVFDTSKENVKEIAKKLASTC